MPPLSAAQRMLPVGVLLAAGLLGTLGSCSDPSDSGDQGSQAAQTDDENREARLSALLAGNSAALERSQAFGHGNDFLRRVRAVLQTLDGDEQFETEDGNLSLASLRAYHQWNSTTQGNSTPRATDFEDPDHPVHEIVRRAQELREQGVDYLLVIIPSRLEIYPELLLPDLAGLPNFPGMSPGTVAFQAELARRGVETVSLLEAFVRHRFGPSGERWLMRKDTSTWTPAGAALASLPIADAVRKFPWYKRGDAVEGTDFQVQYRSMSSGSSPLDVQSEMPIEAVLTVEGLSAHVPDRESPIVLLADVNVGAYARLGGDLAGQLYRHMGRRLDVITALTARSDYWQTLDYRPDPYGGKQLVIEVQSGGFRLPQTADAEIPNQ